MSGIRLSDDWGDPGWVMVPRGIVRDTRLSFKAMGLVTYLASHDSGFRMTREFLGRAAKDGKESIESGLRELRVLGYLTVEQARDDKGRLADGSDYVLHREPATPETRTTGTVTPVSRTPGKPDAGKPATKRDHLLEREQNQDIPDAAAPDGNQEALIPAPPKQAFDQANPAVLTVNQRATRLAQEHYERLGKMGNVAAFMKIIKQAVVRDFSDDAIGKALAYIAENNWTLTAERLANILRGGPKLPSRSPQAAGRVQATTANGMRIER
jgi:pyruvate/2-oxoglutarate dehydrogenase complex dihydrolipoamide acyltransferase (E2) component